MDTSAYVVPATLPATTDELVASVTCPMTRLVLVSSVGKSRFYLPKPWVRLRLADLGEVLRSGRTQAELVALTGLSRARMSQLCAKALERVSA